MKILIAKDRDPIILNDKEFKVLAGAVSRGEKQIIIKNNLVSLVAAQTYDNLKEVEEIYAKKNDMYYCEFGRTWHYKNVYSRGVCKCPEGRIKSPIPELAEQFDGVKQIEAPPQKQVVSSERSNKTLKAF